MSKGRHVSGADFSDAQINEFFDEVVGLKWETVRPASDWLKKEADAYAAACSRPTPHEMRLHIDHAVSVASGWDDPDDARVMFHTAVKAFYLMHWLERLQSVTPSRQIDVREAYRVIFTPRFRKGEPPL